jgi:hypothetical protein
MAREWSTNVGESRNGRNPIQENEHETSATTNAPIQTRRDRSALTNDRARVKKNSATPISRL